MRCELLCNAIYKKKNVLFFLFCFFQVSTPLELPAATVPPKQAPAVFAAPVPAASPRLSSAGSLAPIASPPQVAGVAAAQVAGVASAQATPADDADAELDLLLGLDQPDPDAAGSQPAETTDKHLLQEGGLILGESSLQICK